VADAGRQKMTFTGFDRDGLQIVGTGSVCDRLGKTGPGCAGFESFVDNAVGRGFNNIPALGFGLSFAHPPAGLGIGVNLYTEDLAGIEKFDQQRERTIAVCGQSRPEPANGFIERLSSQRAIDNLRLVVRQIRQFPAFSDGLIGRQILVKELTEALSAPDSLLKNRLQF